MKLTDAEIKEGVELCEKATPGPRKVIQGGQPMRLSKDDENIGDSEGMSIVTEDDIEVVGCSEWMRAEDVDFAYGERLEAENAKLRAALPPAARLRLVADVLSTHLRLSLAEDVRFWVSAIEAALKGREG